MHSLFSDRDGVADGVWGTPTHLRELTLGGELRMFPWVLRDIEEEGLGGREGWEMGVGSTEEGPRLG